MEKAASRRAILHLTTMGDTDIFPPPFEFKFYAEEVEALVDHLADIDFGSYKPTGAAEVLCPKGRLAFRIAHQLYPSDSLLYTTAVIQVAPSIESLRLPVEEGPFSYRFIDDLDNPRLFSESSNYHDWLDHLKDIFGDDKPFADARYVVETDISDFYSRIYFHRIEHVLDDCQAPNSVRKVIEGIIKFSRAKQSYGLPVGTAASRILAEGLLSDTDQMIRAGSVKASRYVDDFRIILDHQQDAHSMLCKLAEHLMLSEGLSLNASKTHIYKTDDGRQKIDEKLSDVFADDELANLSRYIRLVYDDEDVSIEDIDDVDGEEIQSKLIQVIKENSVDFAVVKVLLKALRAVDIEDPIALLESTSELLYFVPRDYCILVGGMAQRNVEKAEEIAERMVSLITTPPFSDIALSRVWVNELFVSQALPISEQIFGNLKFGESVLEKRQRFLLKGILKDRAFFRGYKTKFDQTSDWEKTALMFGAGCLSTGEYKTWLGTIQEHFHDPFSTIYRKWLIANQLSLSEKLKTQYMIKSRNELMAEKLFALDGGDEETPF